MSDSLIYRDDIERAGWFAVYAAHLQGLIMRAKHVEGIEQSCEDWADDTVRASRKRSPEQPRVDSLATVLASTSSADALFPQAGIDLDASGPRVDWPAEFCGERERFTTLAKAVLGPSAWDDLDDYVTPSETLDACLAAVGPRVDVEALAALVGAFGTLDSEISDLTEGPRVSVEIANDIEELFHTARGAVDAAKGGA